MIEKSIAKICGQNLRKFIKEKKLTQQSFAFDYGVDLRTVSRWLNEEHLKDTDVIQSLAKYFKKDWREFFQEP